MRDVTDNRTGELAVGEVKRGRGRPRKPGALSNAERQAAYRARRRAEHVSPMHRPAVDPETLLDVADLEDDMAELRAELDATKAELAEAHETIDELNDELIPLRASLVHLNEEINHQDELLNKALTERDGARAAVRSGGFDELRRDKAREYLDIAERIIPAAGVVKRRVAVQLRAYLRELAQ